MPNTYSSPPAEYMDAEVAPTLIPSNLWSVAYLSVPGILEAASQANPTRVGEVFNAVSPKPVTESINPLPAPTTSYTSPPLRISPPSVTPYDGNSSSLRAFCSQLVNQIQSSEGQFLCEMDKVRFAYQCLGPGALAKMRSSFRCLEDPTVPAEITDLNQFINALKQRCQDPGLSEKSTRIIDTLQQENMRFHDFITIFEDNMTDSTYGHLGKENWKVMLERRLSRRLRNALVMAHGVPEDYHTFVTYLRKKDAAFHEINAPQCSKTPKPKPLYPSFTPTPSGPPAPNHLLVSQGGSAMDLDAISEEKGQDGRLTQQAKEARWKLGHCLRCNKPGHIARNCILGNRSKFPISAIETPGSESAQLKDQLQH